MAITSPEDIAGLVDWFSAKDPATITVDGSSNVTALANKNAGGANLDTVFGTPKSGTRAHNGHNTIDLNGTSALGTWGASETLQPYWFSAAFLVDVTSGADAELFGSARASDVGFGINAAGNWAIRFGSLRDTGIAATTGFHVFVSVFNGTATRFFVDNTELDLTALAISGSADRYRPALIGAASSKTSPPLDAVANYADAAFLEVATYAGTPTEQNITDSYDYLVSNWAASGGAGSTTGTAAPTEAGDTAAASGTVIVSGTADYTEASDTSAAAGTVSITGTASYSDTDDTASGTGTVLVRGAMAYTEQGDTARAWQSVAILRSRRNQISLGLRLGL